MTKLPFPMTQQEVDALLRTDFRSFVQRCFYFLNPTIPFEANWHIDLIVDYLVRLPLTPRARLMINLPPRSLKSIICSIAYPAWRLGQDPSCSIICASYNLELAQNLALETRRILQSDWYQRLFPGTRIMEERSAVHDFMTTAGGGRLATSIGGTLTGRGADLFIIDDPLKPDQITSTVELRRLHEWYKATAHSRMNNQKTGAIVIVSQRLHEDDLTGHLLPLEPWEKIILPAIAEVEETYHYHVYRKPFTFIREIGTALHPTRESLESLEITRKLVGPYVFAGQYQQAPSPAGGDIVKAAWFLLEEVMPTDFDQIIQSWDTANKPGEANYYSACVTFGILKNHIYILHVFRAKLAYPDLKRTVVEQYSAQRANLVLVEDRASGTQLIQELSQTGFMNLKAISPAQSKEMRMRVKTAKIEAGLVHLPKNAHWVADYLHELATFPRGKHDDQVDATSQFFEWYDETLTEPAIITWMRQENERMGLIQPE